MFFILSMFCAGIAFTFIGRSQNIALSFWAVGAFFLFCDWRTNR